MAHKIEWAESAIASLVEAIEYIAKDSPSYAASLSLQATMAADSLGEFAERGRVVPEFQESTVRELFVGRYRLIYRVRESRISIIAFVHSARDLAALIRTSEQ